MFRHSANHLQTAFGLVSFWSSEGNECQCHRRAEGKAAADDNEKHDTYKSITSAAVGFFASWHRPANNCCKYLLGSDLSFHAIVRLSPEVLTLFSTIDLESAVRFDATSSFFATLFKLAWSRFRLSL